MRQPIRGVFFDLYGTLLLYGDMDRAWEAWLTALHEALREQGLAVDRKALGRACDGLFTGPDPVERDRLTLYERRLAELGGGFESVYGKGAASAAIRWV